MPTTFTATPKALGLQSEKAVVQAFWVVTFASLTAVGAQVEIPHQPVPFTLQTLFVLLAGGLLGARKGLMSMSLYLLLGLVGFPVFSSGGFGLARLLGPTGGYLLAFPIAAFLIGWLLSLRWSAVWIVVSLAMGLLVIFTLGTIQLSLVTGLGVNEALGSGFLIFSWWDLLKLAGASAIIRTIGPVSMRRT